MSGVMAITMEPGALAYTEFKYPAGELQVRLTAAGLEEAKTATDIRITARMRNAEDIVRLALLRDAIEGGRAIGASVSLILPYLPYGRADRRFTDGDCSGLRVFLGLIAAMEFDNVVTLDAHSADSIADTGILDVSPMPFIIRAIYLFWCDSGCPNGGINVLFPDAGAAKRYAIGESVGYVAVARGGQMMDLSVNIPTHALNCKKMRDATTGELLRFAVPTAEELAGRPTLIIDDICDGGGTFIGISKEIGPVGGIKLGLYVTHGIFSKGLPLLWVYFNQIYTTDSFAPRTSEAKPVVMAAGEEIYRALDAHKD